MGNDKMILARALAALDTHPDHVALLQSLRDVLAQLDEERELEDELDEQFFGQIHGLVARSQRLRRERDHYRKLSTERDS